MALTDIPAPQGVVETVKRAAPRVTEPDGAHLGSRAAARQVCAQRTD